MKHIIRFCIPAILVIAVAACEKDEVITKQEPPVVVSDSWTENFDSVGGLGAKGWVITNLSDHAGLEAWRKGRYESTNKFTFGFDYVVGFPAYNATRTPNDFISCDMYAGTGSANLSVWLFTPPGKMKNGDVFTFYTRHHVDDGTFNGKDGSDRLQVLGNFKNSSTNVGKLYTDTGDYVKLLDINENLDVSGYPEKWTKFTITLSGITGTVQGRLAFRYFVPGGGPDGNNAALVGIDAVSFKSN